ncbi:unnamed protein product, partial [Mesorhabditis belari]|uniref:Uncharacterized protein n=1 Tax=Mesorhabditis belari TaxID=2138241 RepID=A0AAF3FG64_9BILA
MANARFHPEKQYAWLYTRIVSCARKDTWARRARSSCIHVIAIPTSNAFKLMRRKKKTAVFARAVCAPQMTKSGCEAQPFDQKSFCDYEKGTVLGFRNPTPDNPRELIKKYVLCLCLDGIDVGIARISDVAFLNNSATVTKRKIVRVEFAIMAMDETPKLTIGSTCEVEGQTCTDGHSEVCSCDPRDDKDGQVLARSSVSHGAVEVRWFNGGDVHWISVWLPG